MHTTPFYRVTYRPKLYLGAEREMALIVTGIAIGIPVTGLNIVSLVVGVLIWGISMPLLRGIAKADPHMTRIYLRNLRYAGYYPPRSRPSVGTSRFERYQAVLPFVFPILLFAFIYLKFWVFH